MKSLEGVIGDEKRQWNEILERSSNYSTPTPTDCTMAVSVMHNSLAVFTLATSNISTSALQLLSLFVNPEYVNRGYHDSSMIVCEFELLMMLMV